MNTPSLATGMDIDRLIAKLIELRRYYPNVDVRDNNGTSSIVPFIGTHDLTGTPYLTFVKK